MGADPLRTERVLRTAKFAPITARACVPQWFIVAASMIFMLGIIRFILVPYVGVPIVLTLVALSWFGPDALATEYVASLKCVLTTREFGRTVLEQRGRVVGTAERRPGPQMPAAPTTSGTQPAAASTPEAHAVLLEIRDELRRCELNSGADFPFMMPGCRRPSSVLDSQATSRPMEREFA